MNVALNLLSPEKKHQLKTAYNLVRIENLLIITCVVALLCSGTLLSIRAMFKQSLEGLSGTAELESTEVRTVAERTKLINNYLKRINDLETQAVPWSAMMLQLTDITPPGVQITEVRTEQNGTIRVSGNAGLRADVLLLKTRLENSKDFKNVKAPLSNILSQRNVSFDFEMTYGKVPPPPVTPTKK